VLKQGLHEAFADHAATTKSNSNLALHSRTSGKRPP
jgi:hypothetical protein